MSRSRKNIEKQMQLANRLWEAIMKSDEENVEVINCGTHWDVNGQKIEGDVHMSPSRMRFLFEGFARSAQDYAIEFCYQ